MGVVEVDARRIGSREKKINILVQIGLKKAADLPDVPLLMDLGTNDEDRDVAAAAVGVDLYRAADLHHAGRAGRAGQGTARRVRRDGARSGVSGARKKEGFDIDAVSGEALQRLVEEIVAMPQSQKDRLKAIIE